MDNIEIDSIEISDTIVDITYWISGQHDRQTILFKTGDFERWLTDFRKISVSAYWEANSSSKLKQQIVMDDLKAYLIYRIGMFKQIRKVPVVSYSDKKPMTRVSKSGSGAKGSKSA